jgi:hypothetical protein
MNQSMGRNLVCPLYKTIIAGALTLMLFPAIADPLEDASTAAARGDYAIAMKIWTPLANQGLPAAQAALGHAYFEGPEAMHDPMEAEKWLRKAANQGNVDGQLLLAMFLDEKANGRYPFDFHDADRIESASWYLKAADQNNRVAQLAIAQRFENGWGVPRDYVQAAYWFHEVVEGWTGQADPQRGDHKADVTRRLGIGTAEHELEHLYRAGLGVLQSDTLAEMWATKSIADGYVAPLPPPIEPMPIPSRPVVPTAR